MEWTVVLCISVILNTVGTTAYLPNQSGFSQVLGRLGDSRSGSLKVTQGRSKTGESSIYYIKLPPTPHFYMQSIASALMTSHEKVPVDFTNNGRPDQVYHWNLPERKSQNIRPSSQPAISPPAEVPHYPQPQVPSAPSGRPFSLPDPSGVSSVGSFPSTATPSGGLFPHSDHLASSPSGSSFSLPESSSAFSFASSSVAPSGVRKLTRLATTSDSSPPVAASGKKTYISEHKKYSYNGRPSGIYIYKSKWPVKYRRPLGKFLRN